MWPNRRKNPNQIKDAPIVPESLDPMRVSHVASKAVQAAILAHAEKNQDAETLLFDKLRLDAHDKMKQDFDRRLAANPTPTTQELSLGTYVENLEPQVRDATMALREKGYHTSSSGFFGSDDSWTTIGADNQNRTYHPSNRRAQFMDFSLPFKLSTEVSSQLAELGVVAPRHPGFEDSDYATRLGFMPSLPDLLVIQTQWDAIAALLPYTGEDAPAAPNVFNAQAYEPGYSYALPAE